jgi:uncharacterized membrane protein YhhN
MDRYFACFGLQGSFVLTCLLSLLALVMAIAGRKKERWLILLAMIFSSIGDLFLMDFGDLEKIFRDTFVMGAAAFMVSHVIYAFAYRGMAKNRGCKFLNGGVIAALTVCAACLIYFANACAQRRNFSDFPLAAIYLAVIGANLAVIFSYAWAQRKTNPLTILAAVGAASFFASDFIIGLGMMARISKWNYLIWWLYPIGQILLICAPKICDMVKKECP